MNFWIDLLELFGIDDYAYEIELYRRKFDREGTADARRDLAYALICDTECDENIREGLDMLEELTAAGDLDSQAILGKAISLPHILTLVDLQRSKMLLLDAADKGNPRAQGIVAGKLFHGEDLFDCDPVLAHYYMLEGVRQGDEKAKQMKEQRDRQLEVYMKYGV